MAHFAIFAPPLGGHYRPYSNLADELLKRGHRATFVHHEDARALVDAARAQFAAVGASSAPLASWTRPMGKIRGILGLGGTMKRMEEFTTMLCREGPQLLQQLKVDAVIADQLEPAGGLVAEHLALPWISVATTVPMNREAGIPPPFVDWQYDASAKGLRRNEVGWRISDFILRSFNRCIEKNALELGLPARRSMEDCFSPTLQIAQLIAGLDFPRSQLPQNFAYAGAFRGGEEAKFALPSSDGRPTAYCTLGTLQGSRIDLFEKIAAACVRAGVRLVLTHGRRADPARLARLPGKPLVYDWIPQEEVLRQVDLVICHGGMMTVLDTFSAGLPMLVMPLAFEQPGIAARVARSGGGLMLSRRAPARAIGDAVALLVKDAGYRARAQALAAEIKAAGGVKRAADRIEQSLGVVAPREGPTRTRAERDDARDDIQNENRSAARRDR